MAAPTSVSDLLELIHQNLPLDPARLDAHITQLRRRGAFPGRPADLVALLVRDGFLTPFQGEHLLRGRRPKFLIGKYLILDRIGAGGMGAVYLCEHLQMERLVALKVLPAEQGRDPVSLARFYREAQAVAALNHPNIVRAYDVDAEGRSYFLVMEYVDGVDLQDLVTRRGRLDVTRAAHYIRQAAEGLQHAHEARLVHRDVKPANLLLSRTGVVKVLDLGLARFFHEGAASVTEQHGDHSILGTADYLAPEQARDSGDVDIRADIYSLGVTFYFLLVGRPPFADGTLNQKLLWHQMKAPPPLNKLRPDVPEVLAAVVARMMAKAAAARHQTPAEVVAALAPWTRTPLPPPSPADMRPPRPTAAAGRPWRKNLSASGSSAVIDPPKRATALGGTSAVPPLAATLPVARPLIPSLELPPSPPRVTRVAAPAAPPAPSPAPPQPSLPAEDDWSRLFDDDSNAHQGPRTHYSSKRFTRPSRKYRLYIAGAGAGLLLFLAGVLLVRSLLSAAPQHGPIPSAPAAAPPERPRGPIRLRAAFKGMDAVELTWEDPGGSPNGFRVERATDPYFKGVLATDLLGGDARGFTDARRAPGVVYYYRVWALHASGEAGVSNTACPPPDFGQGFPTGALVLNGGATVIDKALRLTDGNGNEARSAFYPQELDVRAFTTKFRFRIGPGPDTADGFTFCMQGGDTTTVGVGAGGLGYQEIPQSVAVKFDLYNNDGEGVNSTGLFRNGDKPTNPGAIDLTSSGVNLHSGRAYDAAIDYKDGKLTLTITDADDPSKRFTKPFDVDIPATVGGSTAVVGFTGATGGKGVVQDILSWTWQSTGAGN